MAALSSYCTGRFLLLSLESGILTLAIFLLHKELLLPTLKARNIHPRRKIQKKIPKGPRVRNCEGLFKIKRS
jgi:hypothetical protein